MYIIFSVDKKILTIFITNLYLKGFIWQAKIIARSLKKKKKKIKAKKGLVC